MLQFVFFFLSTVSSEPKDDDVITTCNFYVTVFTRTKTNSWQNDWCPFVMPPFRIRMTVTINNHLSHQNIEYGFIHFRMVGYMIYDE